MLEDQLDPLSQWPNSKCSVKSSGVLKEHPHFHQSSKLRHQKILSHVLSMHVLLINNHFDDGSQSSFSPFGPLKQIKSHRPN